MSAQGECCAVYDVTVPVALDAAHIVPKEENGSDDLRRIMDTVEMPDRLAENLIMFIRQNGGTLSKNRRQDEYKALTDAEADRLERIVRDAFEGFEAVPDIKGSTDP